MRAHKGYEPRKRNNITPVIAVVFFVAAVAALWIFRQELAIEASDLFIISGAAIFLCSLAVSEKEKRQENYEQACRLKERQKDIGAGDYSDSSIFFRDNK